MNNEELQSDLNEAIHEIQSLRRRNEILSAKVDTMELMATFLFTRPVENPQECSLDIAYALGKHIEKLKTEAQRVPVPMSPESF